MPRIHTALTDLLDIDSPVVSPPMAGASGGRLAAEVSSAGGFGFIGAGYGSVAAFQHEFDIAKNILSCSPDAPLPIGSGFLGWMLDTEPNTVDMLRVALEQRVNSIWLSFGDDLGKWVKYVRQYDSDRKTPHKTLVWILVNSVAEAERATKEWAADVLVVQGIEAGGHGHSRALPIISLLPLIKQSLSNTLPLVAAGGLTSGVHVAAILVLGASGAALGTRYLTTSESTYTSNQKNALVRAVESVRTSTFDEMRGTVGWPEGIDGRAIPNKTLEDEARGLGPEERKKLFMEAVKNDDTSRSVVWAGSSVGLVNEVHGAGTLTRAIHKEIVTHLNEASAMLKW